jgi:hypothetical protein
LIRVLRKIRGLVFALILIYWDPAIAAIWFGQVLIASC